MWLLSQDEIAALAVCGCRGRGYLGRRAKLKSIELQIAEVNQFWISDLRFGIEESMLEAGAVVDWGFLIWDVS